MTADRETATGLGYSLTTNVFWMSQVLFWPLVDTTGPVELLAHRVIWSAAICLLLTAAARHRRRAILTLIRQRRRLALTTAAAGCLTLAWGVYIYAINSAQAVESSLGLFMVPLSTMLVGVAVFGERLRRWQWVAVGGALAGTAVLTAGYGRLPWIALVLCGLMAAYAALKKKAAAPTLEGFTLECLTMTPLALACLIVLSWTGRDTAFSTSAGHAVLVVGSGLLTAVPLLSHAASLHRLPLTLVGALQYLNPTGQFLLAVFVRHEDMPAIRWAGFCVVWAATAVFLIASFTPGRGGSPDRRAWRGRPASSSRPVPESRR